MGKPNVDDLIEEVNVDDLIETPTGQASLNEPTGVQVPDALRTAANVITTPQRGFRGMGVGIEKAIENIPITSFLPGNSLSAEDIQQLAQNAPGAIERAAAAVEPGYVPQEGEKIGSMVGEAVGSAPLATALAGTGAAPEALFTKQTLFQALRNLGAGSALSAIQQASDKGNIDLHDVAKVGATAAIIPIIRPTFQFVGRVIKNMAEGVTTGTTTLTRETTNELMNNPKFLKETVGTAKAVSDKVVGIQNSLIDYMDDAGKTLNKAREPFGINQTLDGDIENIVANGFTKRTEKEILSDAVDNVTGLRTVSNTQKKLTIGKNGVLTETIIPAEETVSIPYEERVKNLYKTRKELDAYINWRKTRADLPPIPSSEENAYKAVRKQVNTVLDTFAEKDPKVKNLRATDEIYSTARELYDSLQKKLSNEDQAEQTLMKIAKGENLNETIGLTGGLVERLRTLEKVSKKKLIEPLRKELLRHNLQNVQEKGGVLGFGAVRTPTGAVLESLTPEGLGHLLQGTGVTTRLMDQLIAAASRPNVGVIAAEEGVKNAR